MKANFEIKINKMNSNVNYYTIIEFKFMIKIKLILCFIFKMIVHNQVKVTSSNKIEALYKRLFYST